MELLNRRTVLRSSGMALVGLAGSPLVGKSSLTSNGINSADAAPPRHYSRSFGTWTGRSAASIVGKLRAGSLAPHDLHRTSHAVRQYAHHLQGLQFDALSKFFADKIDITHTDLTDTPLFSRTHSVLSSYDPTYTREELAGQFRLTRDELLSAKNSLMTNGLCWHYHCAADALHTTAKLMDVSGVAQLHGQLVDASYRIDHFQHMANRMGQPGLAPHLLEVDFAGVCKKVLCAVLVGVVSGAITRAAIAAFAGLSATEFCTIDVIASLIADYLTAGTASLATELELALCAAAEAAAVSGPLTADVISSIIGVGVASVSSKIGCPE